VGLRTEVATLCINSAVGDGRERNHSLSNATEQSDLSKSVELDENIVRQEMSVDARVLAFRLASLPAC